MQVNPSFAKERTLRKIIQLMHMSLDGFAGGPNGELDWIDVSDDIALDVDALIANVDTALYGRVTYDMMKYWRTVPGNPESTPREVHHAHWIEDVHKVVFSRTMTNADWKNTQIISGNIAQEVMALKQQPGGDMMIFGSPSVCTLLTRLNLIDEYRLTINPVILGRGIPMLHDLTEMTRLKLIDSKPYSTGVIATRYQAQTRS